MPVRVQCPQCQSACQVEPQHVGGPVRCGKCQQVFTAKAAETPAETPPQQGGWWSSLTNAVRSLTTPVPQPARKDTEVEIELDGPAVPTLPLPKSQLTRPLRLDIGSATSRGCVRPRNEDSFLVQHQRWAWLDQWKELALIVVADGMGGHGAGDRASAVTIRAVATALVPMWADVMAGKTVLGFPEQIDKAIRHANRVVYQEAQADAACHGMGATAAVVVADATYVAIGHVGDCRAYHCRLTKVTQVTRDQTLVGRMLDLGQLTPAEARRHPQRHAVTQAIGRNPDVYPAAHQLQLERDDWLLVACDGLDAHVDDLLLKVTVENAPPSAAELAQRLVDLSDQGGGSDNCTVVALRCW